MTLEICINTHKSVFGALIRAKSHVVMQAWFDATLQLVPCKGVQIVSFADAKPKIKKALPELVAAGLLRPYKDSASKFYVPRSKVFASLEERL